MSRHEPRTSRSESYSTTTTTEKYRERCSTDPTEPKTTGFDVHRVYQRFVDALRESNNPKSSIGTQDYIDGYRELSKIFDQLGYVFKFVKDDIIDKLTILQTFVDKDKKGQSQYFDTIQKAIDYETEHNLIKTNPENFTRTLLRLHRALLFIIQFLQSLNDRPMSESTATIASQSYDATLSQYHGFFVRKSVKVGFRVLPGRKQLDDVIFHGRKAEIAEEYQTFMKTIKQIYDIIEAYYVAKKYLQLP